MQLDVWVAFKKMDFLDKEGESTYKVNDMYFSTMLFNHPDNVIERNYMYVRKNDLQLEDDYL